MNDEITWDKGRVAVATGPSGGAIPVWLSDDGDCWRYSTDGRARSIDDAPHGCTLTPREDWTPPRQDGVWLCKGRFGGSRAAFRVMGGKVHSNIGADISDYWTPVKCMCPIPDEWEAES